MNLPLLNTLGFFLIPFGFGIAPGVVFAKDHAVPWQQIEVLYFLSDLILACAFEPLMRHFARRARSEPWGAKLRESWDQSTGKMVALYGATPGPVALVFITFGTDPMTGRIVSFLAGHGAFTGWILTLIGDMLFFTAIMASTLWLDNVLGSGTAAAVIVTGLVVGLPIAIRTVRERYRRH
jgi:hypothetical protein